MSGALSRVAVAVGLIAVGGCALPPLDREASVSAAAASPAYYVSNRGQITPVACRKPPLGGFGGLPPGCARDVGVLAQVVDAGDVLHPRRAGIGSAVPPARAAEAYIYGNGGAGVPGGVSVPGREPATILLPTTAPPAGE